MAKEEVPDENPRRAAWMAADKRTSKGESMFDTCPPRGLEDERVCLRPVKSTLRGLHDVLLDGWVREYMLLDRYESGAADFNRFAQKISEAGELGYEPFQCGFAPDGQLRSILLVRKYSATAETQHPDD